GEKANRVRARKQGRCRELLDLESALTGVAHLGDRPRGGTTPPIHIARHECPMAHALELVDEECALEATRIAGEVEDEAHPGGGRHDLRTGRRGRDLERARRQTRVQEVGELGIRGAGWRRTETPELELGWDGGAGAVRLCFDDEGAHERSV